MACVSIANGTETARQGRTSREPDGGRRQGIVRQSKGIVHGCSTNGANLRLAVYRHIHNEHPGAAAVHSRGGRELERHALRTWGYFPRSLKLGAVLEFGLIVTQIGTAVVIYPLVRRQSETVSLGYVTARIMESVFAAIGIISIISVLNVADSLASATGVGPPRSLFKVIRWSRPTTGRSCGVPDSSRASGTA